LACACSHAGVDAADATADGQTGFQVQSAEIVLATPDSVAQLADVTNVFDAIADAVADSEDLQAADADASDTAIADSANSEILTAEPDSAADVEDVAPVVADIAAEIEAIGTTGNDGFCFFGGPPAADVAIADAPQPALCKLPLPIFIEETPDEPQTLKIELGQYDAMGKWYALQDGDWLQLLHGSQGNLMVLVKFRVVLPGLEEPKAQMQIQSEGFIQCVNVAVGNNKTPYVVQIPEVGLNTYTNASLGDAGVLLVFSAKNGQSWQFCGQWLQLRLAVRDYKNPLKKNWAEVVRAVRLYDSAAVSTVKPP